MTRYGGPRLLLALAIAVSASACQSAQPSGQDSPNSGTPITGPAVKTIDDGVAVVIAGPRESSEEAVVAGTLVVVSDCLALEVGRSSFVVLWPSGSSVTGTGVRLPDGKTFSPGDDLNGVGGFYEEQPPSGTPDLLAGCERMEGVVVVVKADS